MAFLARYGNHHIANRLMLQKNARFVRMPDLEVCEEDKIHGCDMSFSSGPIASPDGKTFFHYHGFSSVVRERRCYRFYISRHCVSNGSGRYYRMREFESPEMVYMPFTHFMYALDDHRLGLIILLAGNMKQLIIGLDSSMATVAAHCVYIPEMLPQEFRILEVSGPHPSGHVILHGFDDSILLPADLEAQSATEPHVCKLPPEFEIFGGHTVLGARGFYILQRPTFGENPLSLHSFEWAQPIANGGCWCSRRMDQAQEMTWRIDENDKPRPISNIPSQWTASYQCRSSSSHGCVALIQVDESDVSDDNTVKVDCVHVDMREFLLHTTYDVSLLRCSHSLFEMPAKSFRSRYMSVAVDTVLMKIDDQDTIIHVRQAIPHEVPSLLDLSQAMVYARLTNETRRNSDWLEKMAGIKLD